MYNRALLLAGGLLVGALVAGGCGDDDEDSATGGSGGTGNTGNQGGSGNTGNEGGSGATGNEGGAGATGGGGAGQGGSGGGPAATCADYCADIEANCTGANAQFGAPGGCPEYCATWEAGSDPNMGNTLACHAYHAGAAADMPEVHCAHAGPSGGAVCGATLCDDFCEAAVELCDGSWPSVADCKTDCMTFATDPAYVAPSEGDNFACRQYHLTAAAADPAGHCQHILVDSDVCVDPD
jgi:hypothetical protein